jgi:hypothetical protein
VPMLLSAARRFGVDAGEEGLIRERM